MQIFCSNSGNFYLDEIASWLVKLNIATEDEIALVTHLMGYSEATLNGILQFRTGYDDLDTYIREVYPEGLGNY